MKIAVFGAGGIGGYFGGRLGAANVEVHLIARGSHLSALRKEGLRVESDLGDLSVRLPATDDPREVGAADVVLFCVKGTETRAAAETLGPLLHANTVVVSLQNGVDNEETLSRAVGADHVAGGVAYILATIARPGVIEHEGVLARMVVGELDGHESARLVAFRDACLGAGIDAEISSDIHRELWRKFAMICAVSGMTAAVRLPLGEIRAVPESLAHFRRIVEEAVTVARARGVELSTSVPDEIVEAVSKLPGEWYSSLHYDLIHGKPMELETLHGTLLRLAGEAGVPAPATQSIYGVLAPWAARNRSTK